MKTRCTRFSVMFFHSADGAANDEAGGQGFDQRVRLRRLEAPQDQPNEGADAVVEVDADRCQIVAFPMGLRDVVETDDLDIIRHRKAEVVPEGIDRTERPDVVGGEDGIGA
ncbi:hypothetical protein D3C72_1967610 [compost metagenome]